MSLWTKSYKLLTDSYQGNLRKCAKHYDKVEEKIIKKSFLT